MITIQKQQYMKRWRAKNKERICQYMKEWEKDHQKERQEYWVKQHKKWWIANKDKKEVQMKRRININKWREKNPEKTKIQRFNQRQRERYKKIFPIWGEHPPQKCEICDKVNRLYSLAIDHNHKTGKIRGLLCHKCNSVLGLVDENKEILLKMIKYLSNR